MLIDINNQKMLLSPLELDELMKISGLFIKVI